MERFKIQNLTFTYPEQEVPALRRIDLSLNPGDFAVLSGSSGCGKSTLLRQLKTVLAPHGSKEGTILFNGTPLETVDERTQTAKIGFVLQDPRRSVSSSRIRTARSSPTRSGMSLPSGWKASEWITLPFGDGLRKWPASSASRPGSTGQ